MNKIFEHDKICLSDVIIGFYFLISFFEPYFIGVIGSVTRYYIFFVMVVAIYSEGLTIKKKRYLIMFIIWLAYKFFSLLWTSNYFVFHQHVITTVGMIGLLVALSSYTPSKGLIKLLLLLEWLGSFTIGVLAIFNSVPFLGQFNERMVLQLFGQTLDPNNEAAFLAVAVAISLYMIIIKNNNIIINGVVVLVNTYALLITGSRGGLLTLFGLLIAIVLISKRSVGFKISLLTGLAAALFVSWIWLKANLSSDIFMRLFDFSSYEGGSSRTDLWGMAFELLSENFNIIFGAGWGAYEGYNGMSGSLHNTFISMLCDVGIIGSCLFWGPIISTCKKMIQSDNILPVLLIITGFVPSFFLEAINKRFFWNVIFILFIYCNYVNQLQVNEIDKLEHENDNK